MIPNYSYFNNIHKGERAFVVGAGTSLFGVDISGIHKDVVISVNSSILLMPWHEGDYSKRYWISNDSLCRRWSWWRKVLNSNSSKIVRNSWSKYFNELEGKNFYQFNPRNTPEDVIDDEDDGLCYCSSVPSGIDFAIKAGCKTVYVLGVDQYMIGNKSHFWQFYPFEKQPKRSDGSMASFDQQRWTFNYNDKAYQALSSFAQRRGVKIFNCNPRSRVKSFDKVELKEVL